MTCSGSRRVAASVLAALAALLVACSSPGSDQAPRQGPQGLQEPHAPLGPPQVHAAWTSCDAELLGGRTVSPPVSGPLPGMADSEALYLPLLADDFDPASVVVCSYRSEWQDDGSEHLMLDEGRTAGVAALVAALRLPHQPPANHPCNLNLPTVVWFILLDADGRWIRPGVPRDGCGRPRPEFTQALGALRLTAVATTLALRD